MRILSPAILGLGLLATASIGCDAPSEPFGSGKANAAGDATTTAAPGTTPDASTFKLGGHVSNDGQGNTALGTGGPNLVASATSVDVMAMASDGTLTTVASAPVNADGSFSADVPAGSSPTQVYIIKAKDVVGAVVGSGVVNGLPAFFKAFVIDAPIDTETSFKAEILDTLAKKGVPGVQNYLNVINTYVNAQLTNSLTVLSVTTNDLTTLVDATSNSILAAEDVIVSSLQSVGIDIDTSALQNAQIAAVSGFDKLTTTIEGKEMSAAESFVQGLEAVSAKAVAPIDQAIFNAVVNGSGAFAHSMKQSNTAHDLQFSATKSAFSLQSTLATRLINRSFASGGTPGVADAVQTGCAAFAAAVDAAGSIADLLTAQTNFTNCLLSRSPTQAAGASTGVLCLLTTVVSDAEKVCKAVESTLAPLCSALSGVYASAAAAPTYDPVKVGAALVAFDNGMSAPPPAMNGAMSSSDANSLFQAVNLVQKQIAL